MINNKNLPCFKWLKGGTHSLFIAVLMALLAIVALKFNVNLYGQEPSSFPSQSIIQSLAQSTTLRDKNQIPFQIPAGWEKKYQTEKDFLRLELKHPRGSIIVLEIHQKFEKNLFEYKNTIWRRQKMQFHSLEKISDRNFHQPHYSDPNNPISYKSNSQSIDQNQQFLLISRFRFRNKQYIQRTMGKKQKDTVILLNFVAPQREFYKQVAIFNAFSSHVQRTYKQSEFLQNNSDLKNPDKKQSNRPASDLDIDKKNNKKNDKNNKNQDSNAKDNQNPDPNAIDPKTAKFDYFLLDDGNWGYCTKQSIKNENNKYEKKKFFDGKKGWCSIEDN